MLTIRDRWGALRGEWRGFADCEGLSIWRLTRYLISKVKKSSGEGRKGSKAKRKKGIERVGRVMDLTHNSRYSVPKRRQ
jgi:hypothetical protein